MHVAWRIIADGHDVTGRFQDRLISLTLIDEAGQKSDSAEITLDDRDYRIALPEVGAKLTIALGLVGALVEIGTYVVDEISGALAPDLVTIRARAADMLGAIRARRTRSWKEVTLEDIVKTIAGQYRLTPQISDSLKAQFYAYLAQTAESDLNLLTRLAKDLDAVAKPAGGALLVVKRGEAKAANGTDLPVFPIHRHQIRSGSWTLTGRGRYGRVTAEWAERDTATVHKVTAGKGEPERILRHRYPTQADASRAAQAALSRSHRGSGSLSIELGGFYGDLMAEANVNLLGIKPELAGQWLITRVTHRLTDTLTTSFEAERDNSQKTPT